MTWITDVLSGIGAPATPNNVQALTLWAQSEGIAGYANNWLATEQRGYGGAPYGPSPNINQFPTEQAGVEATIANLKASPYSLVVSNLRSGNASLSAIWSSINNSPWCANCQGGKYPVALAGAAGPLIPAGASPGNTGIPGNASTAGVVSGSAVDVIPGASTVANGIGDVWNAFVGFLPKAAVTVGLVLGAVGLLVVGALRVSGVRGDPA